MVISQEELTKLCKYLYFKFFDYKDIILSKIDIKVSDSVYIDADLNYYGIDTKVCAKADLRIKDNLIINIEGNVKYGFINFSINKILKEMLRDYQDIKVTDHEVIVLNDFLKNIELKNEYVCIELK
ncbi:MAG: hypothetical protein KHX14_03130 [[Clostridium] spiroforme]|uniref:Uncharacterized protein n=1 Tax=Thomasclavelia spiroformis TaxID=29348 RepID=A0A943I5S7_9FIRM|nr:MULTISPECIES: hypothetical protein [Thomasclavelia]MBS5587800.1 hypothetical protein [Thomasclavelia spiroformis]